MKHSVLLATITVMGLVVPAAPAAAAACAEPGGGALPSPPALSDEIVFTGRGFGHGTGMSQYGARGAAELGCTHLQILQTYYPGTAVSPRANQDFRLSMVLPSSTATTTKKATVQAHDGPVGWQVCDPGPTACEYRNWQPAGETWIARVRQDASAATASVRIERLVGSEWQLVEEHAEGKTVRIVLRSVGDDRVGPQITLNAHDGGQTRRLARGLLEITPTTDGSDAAFVTLHIGMEQYLYGLGEIPTSWHEEALRAQVIAARSFAYERIDNNPRKAGWARYENCRCHLYATTKDQNYVGYAKETEGSGAVYGARWVAAVQSTNEQVLTYDGKVIPAFYSSVHGGSSESYAFWSGGSDRPYLQAVEDSRWEQAGGSPLSAWAVGFGAAELGAALGVGTVTDVQLPQPVGAADRVGRPDAGYGGVIVSGTSGTWKGSGAELRSATGKLGNDCWDRTPSGEVQRLCSSLFTVEVNLGPKPVPPPAGATRLTGDWDGDGIDTPGWFKDGKWGLHDSHSSGGGTTVLYYGRAGDIPVVGDWNGDGRDTIGVVRGNKFILRYEYRSGADIVMYYGRDTDKPVVGDWDGNGTDTLGVVRGNKWILRNEYRSGADDIVMYYGLDTDKPVVGDWDGNGTDTLGVVRGNKFILRNVYRSGADDIVMYYGRDSDTPVTGDWNGDGTDTLGVVRGNKWILRYVYRSGADIVYYY